MITEYRNDMDYVLSFFFQCGQGKDPIPEFDGDFYMMVQEWIQEPSEDLYHRLQYELIS